MNPRGCEHERDVLDLVAIGQWPARADAVLRAHVLTCAECAEVASVAAAVREWADDAPAPRVPDASVVWYRAMVRARTEAARRATRPVLAAQVLALFGLVLGSWWLGPTLIRLLPRPNFSLPSLSGWLPDWPSLTTTVAQWSTLGWAIALALTCWIVIGSIAWALTSARE